MLPSLQFPDPAALVETRLITHVLVAGLFALGIGSGGPKRQPGFPGYSGLLTPAAVQLRLLPVSRSVVAARVRFPVPVSQAVTLVSEVPWSGMTDGRGTPICGSPVVKLRKPVHPQQSQPAAGTVLVVVGPATLVEVVVDVDVVV